MTRSGQAAPLAPSSSAEDRPFLLGRKHWRFMMVFVVALSLMAGFFGSAHQDVDAVLLTVMVTIIDIVGLWLLPPALSPRLLAQRQGDDGGGPLLVPAAGLRTSPQPEEHDDCEQHRHVDGQQPSRPTPHDRPPRGDGSTPPQPPYVAGPQ
ncbi:hypothetical protein ACJ6WF_40615 [Streptomyces sp. MMS24-I2-30]|uniref:hypothetical protein n=1 Tax=Streptomyces sp. MMS24-I2-30 TaxID=3351564 RepID=UPI003896E276